MFICFNQRVNGAPVRNRLQELLDSKPTTDSAFIRNAFSIADEYMSLDHNDSAQLWLNKIHEWVSYRQPSLFSYFLTSRQAEVYYYNNLQELGMQEAQRAIYIAEALKDSLLLADAYNFTGLFLMNMNNTRKAIPYFKKGIDLCKRRPDPIRYIELSKPHHLYGNLSEAYEKLNEQDSAIYYARLSLQRAAANNLQRGVASAALSMANVYVKKRREDSAIHYFEMTRTTALFSKNFDIALSAYGGLAICAATRNDRGHALGLIKDGFRILDDNPQLNSFYALLFLDQAIFLYKSFGLHEQLSATLERKLEIQTSTHHKNNHQYRSVLMTGLKNETRILGLEVARAQHERQLATTRFYVVALVFLLLIAGFFAYRYYARQQLKMAYLRNKISQDLHDEVGATLSGIALYSYIAKQQNQQQDREQVTQSLDIIDKNATDMVKKLSDIVWAVNPVHDSLDGLMQRLEEYALEMAAAKDISVLVKKEAQAMELKLRMEQRKNIYLVMKEAINNAVKYGFCKHLWVVADLKGNFLILEVNDDGKGFEQTAVAGGNGLLNMQQRAAEMHAALEINSKVGEGTSIRLTCKITQ